ncbi:VOC family protein [Nakamurella sp. YIM 132087]|uniref:VOC family protein n=1 Tax=Nakamurella alba TaxID=2665158 RepID=A0A7K1FVJ2_9ACTN|nr:VOC family protein [Nakamurella alba]MTD17379.1 VOC family protein [Nakamurella alba]
MDQRVSFVTVATDDLEAARRFYGAGGIGWTPLMDVPGEILFFQIAPGLVLGLFDTEKFKADGDLAPTPAGSPSVAGLTLSHNLGSPEEVSRVVAELEAAGGEVTVPPTESDFGGVFRAHVRDPNGIIWEIAHIPTWRVHPDGSVTLV